MTAVAAGLFALNIAFLPKSVLLQYSPSVAAAMLEFGPMVFFTVAVTVAAFFHALHQLRMVDRIHDMVLTVDLLRARSLHVFSGLTSRTGVSFLLVAYYVAAVRPDFVSQSPLLHALLLAVVPIAVACFVLPLRRMHRRLAGEKERTLTDVTAHLQELFRRLHDRVDRGVLEEADKLNMQITGLVTERDLLSRVSTWPWDPATLTGFVSALVVPVILWAAQRLLEHAL